MAKKSTLTTKQALQKMSEGYELHISSLVAHGRLFSYRLYSSPSAIDPLILSERVGEKVRMSKDIVRAQDRIVAFTDVYIQRTPQPTTVSPADEAALGVSMSELDAAMETVSAPPTSETESADATLERVIAVGVGNGFASYDLRFDNGGHRWVFQRSSPAEYARIADKLWSQGWVYHPPLMGKGEAVWLLPEPAPTTEDEPDMRDHRLASMYTDYRADARLNANTSAKSYTEFLEDKINNMDAQIKWLHSQLDKYEAQQITERVIPATATRPAEIEDVAGDSDLVSVATGLPDEREVYVEYEARFRQLDDHLYSADDVLRKMDDLEA